MKFLHPEIDSQKELTFSDLFILQQVEKEKSEEEEEENLIPNSRFNIKLTPNTPLSTTIPIISANMNSVTGKRMSETLARYGGMGVLPQDMSLEKMIETINSIHAADTKFDTPLTVTSKDRIDIMSGIIGKRAHDTVVMIDENRRITKFFSNSDIQGISGNPYLQSLQNNTTIITGNTDISYDDAYNIMDKANISSLPIIDKNGILKGIITKLDAVIGEIYNPSLNKKGQLNVSVALGINGYKDKIDTLLEAGIDTLVLDTAHGLQNAMIASIKDVRNIVGDNIQIIAGNICTSDGAKRLIDAGANGVKVGIGPGAMCTTRMQTGVGRPQFSAIKDCSEAAKGLGGYVWADGGIKEPRDLALAIAAGASHVMIGSRLAGTYESTGEIKTDKSTGKKYKSSYGMASGEAVRNRNKNLSPLEIARKELFQEGISESKIYMKEGSSSVLEILNIFTGGFRSTVSYTGADNIEDYQERVIIGVQTSSGYAEGKPHTVL